MPVATPTAFPAPGLFHVAQRLSLFCATPGADIHFTTDGSEPTADSPMVDEWDPIVLEAVNDGDKGVVSTYRIKAIAVKAGVASSAVASFDYTIDRRDKGVYLSTEIHPGIFQIRDYDDTKMMLVVGSERAVLIDAGLGNGALKAFIEPMVGGKPLDLVITHGHPDHIAAMAQFQGNRHKVFMNSRDLPMVGHFNDDMHLDIDLERIDELQEGMSFELGGRRLDVYEVPGHSPGHVVLFDEANGLLFASDAIGSNRAAIPDSLWMQFPGMSPIDEYLSTLQGFRAKVGGKINETYGGHNDAVIYGESYMENLERAAQKLVDEGESALVPSLRPARADVFQVVVGDRLTDADWAAINVRKETCLSVPAGQIASLSQLSVEGAVLEPAFRPGITTYRVKLAAAPARVAATAMSGRHRALTINGAPAVSREPVTVATGAGDTTVVISVTSPDGTATGSYTLTLVRG